MSEISPSRRRLCLVSDNCNGSAAASELAGQRHHLYRQADLAQPLEPRHMDGMNFAFFDGHVKWFRHGDASPSLLLSRKTERPQDSAGTALAPQRSLGPFPLM